MASAATILFPNSIEQEDFDGGAFGEGAVGRDFYEALGVGK